MLIQSLVILWGLFSPAWAFGATQICVQAVANAGITVRTVSAADEDLGETVAQILAIQSKLWLADRHSKPSEQGFLIGKWSPEETQRLVRTEKVLVAESEGKVVGYTILVEGRVFESALRPGLDSILCHRFRPDFGSITYLQQIGVDPDSARAGVGSALVRAAKEISPQGIFLAILALPFHNAASYAFFQKQGFTAIGFLDVTAYEALGDKRSHLMYWKEI